MLKITKGGIYLDMSARDYFADPCPEASLTQSIAKILIDRSPAHAWLAHPKLNPNYRIDDEAYDKAQAIGNAAHKLMIGRGKELCIIEAESFRTDKVKETRDKAAADGYVPILAKHHKGAKNLTIAARGQLDMIGLTDAFYSGDGEVVITWQEDGLWFRSMIDWLISSPLHEVYDLKTGGTSAAPHAIPYRMVDQGWPVQAAFQERGLDALAPEWAGRRTFRFVAVENEPPYALSVHEMSEAVMTLGRKQVQHAVDIWRRCMESGEWPAYAPVIHRPEYPGFREQQWLNREIAEFESNNTRRGRPPAPMLTSLAGG